MAVLSAILDGPSWGVTDEELAERLSRSGHSASGVRTRRKELERDGIIVAAGVERLRSGRMGRRWTVKPTTILGQFDATYRKIGAVPAKE